MLRVIQQPITERQHVLAYLEQHNLNAYSPVNGAVDALRAALLTWLAMGEAANQPGISTLVAGGGFDLYIFHAIAMPIVPASLAGLNEPQ